MVRARDVRRASVDTRTGRRAVSRASIDRSSDAGPCVEEKVRADARVLSARRRALHGEALEKVWLSSAGERSVPHATVGIDETLAFNHARDG